MQLELVRELARSVSPCRCRAGAGDSSEKIAWSPRTKNSTPKMPWPPSASTILRDWKPRRLQRLARDRGGLPAFAIVAALLPVADRRAEQDAVLGRDGQQRDLAVELDEFLDDHPRPVAAHVGDGIVPRRADLVGRPGGALALARARHDRLDHARQADLAGGGDRFVAAFGEAVFRGDEPELAWRRNRGCRRGSWSAAPPWPTARRASLPLSSSARVAVSIASISGTMTSGLCFSTAARSALPSSIGNTSNASAICIAGAFA